MKINGKDVTPRYTFRKLAELEERLGRSLGEIIKRFDSNDFSITEIIEICDIGYDDLDKEDLEAHSDKHGLEGVFDMLGECINCMMSGPTKLKAGAGKKPKAKV